MNDPSKMVEIPRKVLQNVAMQLGKDSATQAALDLGQALERQGYHVRYTYDPTGVYRVHQRPTVRSIWARPLERIRRVLQRVLPT